MSRCAITVTAATSVLALSSVSSAQLLSVFGQYKHNGDAEIPAFDPASQRAFVVNGGSNAVDILNLSNPAIPSLVSTITVPNNGAVNSVAIKNGIVAVAAAAPVKTDPGAVHFYDTNGVLLNSVTVGALPDMITFTPDGLKVLTANEGEPNSYNQPDSVDPEGSVSIIDLSGGVGSATVSTAGFATFNGQVASLRASGVRIFGPGATVAQDLEPEYVTIKPDSSKAFVSLQENNAIAEIDLNTNTVTAIRPLGLKSHALAGNELDPSDKDNGSGGPSIKIAAHPVFGMYQPDAIAVTSFNGQTYLLTANEGDARDYTGFSEESRIGSSGYVLDPTVFPNAAALKSNAVLGRLTATNQAGDNDNDGDFDQAVVFGGRSFSVFSESGTLVFDSGAAFENITAAQLPGLFNSDGTTGSFDARSDNKGPEPEGIVIGQAFGRTWAFIGLERVGGVMVYDITDPTAPQFHQYFNTLAPDLLGTGGERGPEGLCFIPADQSPTGQPLLIVSAEVSGTTGIYTFVPEPSALALLAMPALLATRRRRAC